jgi:hypothetical protein
MAMIDWERTEHLYRQGEISVREIARREGVSDGAVRKRAKAKGWSRESSTQLGVDAEVEAVALAIRSIPTQGVRVHERVFWAYARAAVEAAGRARRQAFQRRAQLNKPNSAPETEVPGNELTTEGPHSVDS